MKTVNFVDNNVIVNSEGQFSISSEPCEVNIYPRKSKLGVMVVGLGGNNGTTMLSGLLAQRMGIIWNGKQSVKYYGSMSQYGSVHIGYDNDGNPHSRLFKDIGDMYNPEDLVIGGWDICGDNMYDATVKANVIDYDLLRQLEPYLSSFVPLPSIYNPDFIATNQGSRATNVLPSENTLHDNINKIVSDIENFKKQDDIDNIIILWCASTERFSRGKWSTRNDLMTALENNDSEISPSIQFAVAAAQTGCIFLNGSPQNTINSAIIENAKYYNTFVGGEDFKTGQTKIKSVLADWLVSSGIKPLSIVSYNHLGNNDGKNLDETPQFKSKEITKKNVIDDVVDENPTIFPNGNPDHSVVIKYIPAVGDSKRALDEYYSEIYLGGRHTLSMHNTCEDSLLAVPIILDIILFADFFSRITIKRGSGNHRSFGPVLSMLSLFFKAPVTNGKEPLVNAFFRQRASIENFFRVIMGLPPTDHMLLSQRQ